VEVGDGSDACLKFARVDFLQIVWTHDCEHGYVHGMALERHGTTVHLIEEEDVQFGPEQLVARLPASWSEDGCHAELNAPLPPEESLLFTLYEDEPPPPPLAPAPPPASPPSPPWQPPHNRAAPPAGRRGGIVRAQQLECTYENVERVLASFKQQAASMFGCHAQVAAVGITGDLTLVELDGPVVIVAFSGCFWHRRETVLANAATFIKHAIPEIAEVIVEDESSLLDKVIDEETGVVVEDRRSPDFNGDRETLEYQGIDPDSRGPFPQGVGGLRAGGSMFS